ncbi:probable thermophilic glucose-6-phosphate isomerase and related metalloenzymes [Rhynchosporium secalis]|uniref:Probable thermophilic glucose-6-phosphate isomerase and related metalloenzymes n=1 Tax=Rhynchosporium secalis TaxID=38038 RepID=A0A1E1MAJ2_RHYSE|nr:probable thermophilic glucose-6-phosphate isomerase and related metalloenzymes [Rhynchosporium secalis]
MHFQIQSLALCSLASFVVGQPADGKGKGGPFSGGTNHQLDLANPDNLGAQSTDNGLVPNLKWSFSDSKARIFNGGWTREQVVTDLPASRDIAAAQQHLKKGASRELHWHRVAEWCYVYAGEIQISAVDEYGRYQVDKLQVGDVWYFPKGSAHTIQGLADENEYLLCFDDCDFDRVGTTFMVDDWIAHTPKSILAKNFGEAAGLFGNSSYVIHASQYGSVPVPGEGGTFSIIDSTNFPIATTIAAAIVTHEPKGLRELHWHPNAKEWLYFHTGTARATVFIGGANARTFDFTSGDTAVFPDNSGHYIENTSETEKLVWIEIYKSDRVVDISPTQWLALTPPDIVANTLKISKSVVDQLKKEK